MKNNKGDRIEIKTGHKAKTGGKTINFSCSEKLRGIFPHLLEAGTRVLQQSLRAGLSIPALAGWAELAPSCSLVKVDTLWLFPSRTSQESWGFSLFLAKAGSGVHR